MQTVQSTRKIRELSAEIHKNGENIALVPTMGSLHQGHESLINAAKKKADRVIVACFVNPLAFGPHESPDKYPQNLKEDSKKCKKLGVDYLFAPKVSAIFPEEFSSYLQEENLSQKLGGKSIAPLFRGYLTAMNIFYNLILPNHIVIGQKDYHQSSVLKKIAKDLHWNCKVHIEPIFREDDNVASSARNLLLNNRQRTDAQGLPDAINIAKKLVADGTRSVDRITAEVSHHLSKSLKIRINYVKVVDPKSLKPIDSISPKNSLLVISVWLDQLKLNDNAII